MSVPGPVLGPCSVWITGDDVAACCSTSVGSDTALLDLVAAEASMAMWELSGRQFTGLCERTVRPCRDTCGCFGQSASLGMGPWYWSTVYYGGSAGSWRNECGDTCGCSPLSKVRLSGYPVVDITEVKIDGAVVDPAGYRLDKWRYLIRLSDPGPPVVARAWPGCQDLSLDDTQAGTFSVSYEYGVDPPQLGKDAAAALACQLWLACNGADCKLPTGTTRVTRQGITVERGLLINWFNPQQSTGIVAIDLFLAAYWRNRAWRRPAVWSPDVQQFARKVGP